MIRCKRAVYGRCIGKASLLISLRSLMRTRPEPHLRLEEATVNAAGFRPFELFHLRAVKIPNLLLHLLPRAKDACLPSIPDGLPFSNVCRRGPCSEAHRGPRQRGALKRDPALRSGTGESWHVSSSPRVVIQSSRPSCGNRHACRRASTLVLMLNRAISASHFQFAVCCARPGRRKWPLYTFNFARETN